jgi:hypothetical protein
MYLLCVVPLAISKTRKGAAVSHVASILMVSSFGVWRLFLKFISLITGEYAARVLRDLATYFNEAGWSIQRVLTDLGSEFRASSGPTSTRPVMNSKSSTHERNRDTPGQTA